VWDIADPRALARDRQPRTQNVDRCKRRILETLLAVPEPVFIAHPDDPEDDEVPGEWLSAADGTWRLPRDLDLDHPNVKSWLHSLGNWVIYAAPQPATLPCPDTSTPCEPELIGWMTESAVSVVVDSFHDDDSWVVALEPPALA
jgi:hypothetical protein